MTSNYKELIKQYYKRFPSAKVQNIDSWLRKNHPQEYKQYQTAVRQAMSGENIRQPQVKPTVPAQPKIVKTNPNVNKIYTNAKTMEQALSEQGIKNTPKPNPNIAKAASTGSKIKGIGSFLGKGNAILGTGLTALEAPAYIRNMTSSNITIPEKILGTLGYIGGIPTGGFTAGSTNAQLTEARKARELLQNDSLKDRELYNQLASAGLLNKQPIVDNTPVPNTALISNTPINDVIPQGEPQLSQTPNMSVENYIKQHASTNNYLDSVQDAGSPVNLNLGINTPNQVQPPLIGNVNALVDNMENSNFNNAQAASNIRTGQALTQAAIDNTGNINNRYRGVNPLTVQNYLDIIGQYNQTPTINPDELKAAQERDRRAKQMAGIIDFANSYRPREQTLSGVTMFGMYPNAEQFRYVGEKARPFLETYQSAEAELLAKQKAANELQQQQMARRMEGARIVNAVDMAEQFQIPLGLAMSMQDDPKAAADIITNNENARNKLGEEGLKSILGYLGKAAENNAAYNQAVDVENIRNAGDINVANINQYGGLLKEQQSGINSQAVQRLRNEADRYATDVKANTDMMIAQENNRAKMDLERLKQQSPEVYARLVNSYNMMIQNGVYFNDPTARNMYQQYSPLLMKDLANQLGINIDEQPTSQSAAQDVNAMQQWMMNRFNR